MVAKWVSLEDAKKCSTCGLLASRDPPCHGPGFRKGSRKEITLFIGGVGGLGLRRGGASVKVWSHGGIAMAIE